MYPPSNLTIRRSFISPLSAITCCSFRPVLPSHRVPVVGCCLFRTTISPRRAHRFHFSRIAIYILAINRYNGRFPFDSFCDIMVELMSDIGLRGVLSCLVHSRLMRRAHGKNEAGECVPLTKNGRLNE